MDSRASLPLAQVSERLRRAAQLPQTVVVLITFAVYAAYSVSRYQKVLTAGYDLGIFDQVVRRYSHFQAPIVDLKGPGYNIFGDHFHPILATIAPLYWVWDDPRVLLIVQAGLIAAATWIVHRFCSRHLSANASMLVTTGFALGWPLQNLTNFDFHEIAFGVPIAAWAIDALDRRSKKEFVASCVLLLLVREDMGLVVAILALVGLPRMRLRVSLGLAGIGVAMYVIATSVILPHFNPSGTFAYWTYDSLGPDAPSALKSLLIHPWHGINLFFTPSEKSITLLWLFAPVLLLAFASPFTLCCLPILAERFFSSRENLWGTQYHYSSILWPFLVLGAIDGARRLNLLSHERRVRWASALVALLPVVGTLTYTHLWPLNRAITGKALHSTAKMRYQYEILRLIPHSTCVESEDHLASHLTRWNKVLHPTADPVNEDFIILDTSRDLIGYELPATTTIDASALRLGYTMYAQRGTVIVLKRPHYTGPSSSCSPTSS